MDFCRTPIGSYVYKKIETFVILGDPSLNCVEGYIREDTSSRKIYYIDCRCNGSHTWCDTTEMLLYDFSKLPGDTVIVNSPESGTYPHSLIPDIIIIDTSLSQSRLYRLYGIDDVNKNWPVTWIEGVGSLSGLELNIVRWPDIELLLCSFKDSVRTFHYSSFLQSDTCIIDDTVGLEERNLSFIKVFPNPATESLHISLPAYVETSAGKLNTQYSPQSILLTDLSGKTMLQTREITIPLKAIASGLYFVSVHLTNGQSVVRKVVVE